MHKLLLILIMMTTIACGQNDSSSKIKEKLLDTATEGVAAIQKFQKGDYSEFRLRLREIKSALAKNEYLDAIKAARHIDNQFESKVIERTVKTIAIYSKEGSEKAHLFVQSSIEALPEDSKEKEYLKSLSKKIETIDKKEFASIAGNLVAGSVYIALESKMNHSGAIPASIAGAATQIVIEELL